MDARLEDRLFRSVLVVDPYPTGRGAVSAALAELGYRVVAVATAAEGRPIAEGGEIDMIVADADVAAIRSLILDLQASGRSIPTVLLTTQGLFARRVPNTTMLQKPTGLDALSSALTGSLLAERTGSSSVLHVRGAIDPAPERGPATTRG